MSIELARKHCGHQAEWSIRLDALKEKVAFSDGVGDGVLAIDANGDGKITARNEVIFTDWDASADGDLDAIRSVIDSNGTATANSMPATRASAIFAWS